MHNRIANTIAVRTCETRPLLWSIRGTIHLEIDESRKAPPPASVSGRTREIMAGCPFIAFFHNRQSGWKFLYPSKVMLFRLRVALSKKITPPRRLSGCLRQRWRIASSRHPRDEKMTTVPRDPFAFFFSLFAMLEPLQFQLVKRPIGKLGLNDLP